MVGQLHLHPIRRRSAPASGGQALTATVRTHGGEQGIRDTREVFIEEDMDICTKVGNFSFILIDSSALHRGE